MNKPSKEEIEKKLQDILSSSKPKIIAARLTSLPIPEHIDKHLRSSGISYLWNLTPIVGSPMATDNGMHLGVWITTEIDYVHLIIASKEVVEYYANMNNTK